MRFGDQFGGPACGGHDGGCSVSEGVQRDMAERLGARGDDDGSQREVPEQSAYAGAASLGPQALGIARDTSFARK